MLCTEKRPDKYLVMIKFQFRVVPMYVLSIGPVDLNPGQKGFRHTVSDKHSAQLFILSPLRISTPKLIGISIDCVIHEKFLGVLIPNNGSDFECMLMKKYTENPQK